MDKFNPLDHIVFNSSAVSHLPGTRGVIEEKAFTIWSEYNGYRTIYRFKINGDKNRLGSGFEDEMKLEKL